ncbi:MAG: phosphate signaling complex protein PhoU [Deltaproteobacteria bacterium]|jgi:phosphate transport system protein|nr:phosphate signaling complex protein PhoU [Deltaproteobacteria bacterium]MBW2491581.1 phosphate signaling complex protein PhoU [Deltaproteobacteria bacterium]
MAKHFDRELEKLKKKILSLGALVEERVYLAIKAIETRDPDLAEKIIRLDHEIDENEVEVEEECLKVLALYQPVAIDLRFIVTVIKINNDLERIGDEAVNIAERIQSIAKRSNYSFHFDYTEMAEIAAAMLKQSLDALVNLDIDTAFRVLTLDDEVDDIQSSAYSQIKQAMRERPQEMTYLINLYLISRHLERIADHATNIAEEVIYLIEGEIVRHGKYL